MLRFSLAVLCLTVRSLIHATGPMESVFPDFWRMVWQENISVIIMLTNLEEGEKVTENMIFTKP